MAAEESIFRDMVNYYELAAVANFLANRGLYPKFATGLQTEGNFVVYGTSDPAIFGYPGNSGKP
jgi:hypothetical protein